MSMHGRLLEKLEELGELIEELREYDETDMDYIASRIEKVYEDIMDMVGE